MTDTNLIKELYDSLQTNENENERLVQHRLEGALTIRTLNHHLNLASGGLDIADIGGGTGFYALRLASLGHQVSLVDLSPGLLSVARQDPRSSNLVCIRQGNALNRALFEPMSQDAVLLLGPLYHLVDESERIAAIEAALNYLRPGGTLFLAFVTVHAHLRDIAVRAPEKLLVKKSFYDEYLPTGKYITSTAQSFHIQPDAVEPLVERAGGRMVEMVAVEGILGGLDKHLSDLPDGHFDQWVERMYYFGRMPGNWACGDHLLAVVRQA
jgi:SAM-dependent methyltransferase